MAGSAPQPMQHPDPALPLTGPLGQIRVFSTSPQSLDADPSTYLDNVAAVARWSEGAGCAGILVYTDNGIVDPWLVAQAIIQNTESLCPLVAVQPIYMHPYAVAKMIASLAFMHRRRVYLNMVAGGFKNDLTALNDLTPHDRRYDRMIEYVHIIQKLVCGGPVTFEGEFYQVRNLSLKPPVPASLVPGIFVSGSSEAGLHAARAMRATAIKYPGPPEETSLPDSANGEHGIRLGIIARSSHEEAWKTAHERFPDDRRGQLAHQLAMKVSDSQWHRELSSLDAGPRGAYWLGPFQTSKTNCPYLVGTYDEVSSHLSAYMRAGFSTYILDIPPSREELEHIGRVFEDARRRAA